MIKSLLAGVALVAVAASPALSSPITANVQFWSYNASPTFGPLTLAAESNPIIATTPTATFTYSGELNWDSASTNTVAAFIHAANLGGISNFASSTLTQAQFLASQLSVGGDSVTTFWRFTGALSSTGGNFAGSITHDDGTTFIVGPDTLVSSPAETVSNTSPWNHAGNYTNAPFILDYVEGNGVPAILHLDVTTPFTTAIPETSTWLMMIAGFFGLGFMAYRRKSQGSLRLA